MRNLTVDAVILKKHPRGEHDVSVTLYAPTLGRIHATAKGARKIHSNFTGHLDTLNICRIQLYCNGPHYTITQCQAINTHKEIRDDLERSIMALLLLEIVQKTTYSTETGTKLFELIRTTLEHLSKTTKTTLIIETFKIKLLAELGVLLRGALGVLGPVEDLEQELVAQLGLEAVLVGVLDRDLPALDCVVLDDVDDEEQVDRAGLDVVLRLHLAVHPERALGGGQDRLLQGLEEDGPVDVLVSTDLVDDHAEVGFHGGVSVRTRG